MNNPERSGPRNATKLEAALTHASLRSVPAAARARRRAAEEPQQSENAEAQPDLSRWSA